MMSPEATVPGARTPRRVRVSRISPVTVSVVVEDGSSNRRKHITIANISPQPFRKIAPTMSLHRITRMIRRNQSLHVPFHQIAIIDSAGKLPDIFTLWGTIQHADFKQVWAPFRGTPAWADEDVLACNPQYEPTRVHPGRVAQE